MNTPATELKPYLQNKTYQVLQKDAVAHVIDHQKSGITAYTIFEANKLLKGILVNADVPLMAMFKKKDAYSLLTIANPDIEQPKWNHNMSHMPDGIPNGSNKGGIVTVTLKGLWFKAADVANLVDIDYKDGNSIIKVFCKDGKRIDIPLSYRPINQSGDE